MICIQRVRLILGVITVTFGIAQFAQASSHSITHTQTTFDSTDFQAFEFGLEGYYFPQFDASSPVSERPTDENMQFSPPSWAGFQFDSTQSDRTFSLDAGCFSGNIVGVCFTGPTDPLVFGVYSEGGLSAWDTFTLPNGSSGLSGAAVDEAADNNSNNSVNRIQLGAGTPSSFLLRIVVDNTNQQHDPAGRLRARGDSGGVDVDVNLTGLTFNGASDVYTFRYDNFVAGDFIKIQLNSGVAGEDPSIGGLMFDLAPDANFDGDIDGRDFLIWQRGFQSGTTQPEGDANFSGSVNAVDLAIWELQFGQPPASLMFGSAAVPEPSAVVLLVIGALALPLIGTGRVLRAGN